MIATNPGGPPLLVTVTDDTGGPRTATLPAFLIECAVMPGSSGSPVFLKPVTGRLRGESIMLPPCDPYFLGIVSQGWKAPIDVAQIGAGTQRLDWWSGLGLVFRADTVRETVEMFLPEASQPATPADPVSEEPTASRCPEQGPDVRGG